VFRQLKKRVTVLETKLHVIPPADEFSIDWNMLQDHERELIVACARIEIKYRVRGEVGEYDFSNASEEEKLTRKLAQDVMQEHAELQSVIDERYYVESIH